MNLIAFRLILAALILAFVAHRGYYTRKVQHAGESILKQPEAGAATKVAGVLTLPALLSTAAYIFFPAWLSWSALELPLALRYLAVGITLAGFALLQWSQVSLGVNWSDTPRLVSGQQVVAHGPYRRIRHPIYAAFLLILGSTLLISANWLVGGLWIASTGLDIAARIRTEEAMLEGQFGDIYRSYALRTGRLIPRLTR